MQVIRITPPDLYIGVQIFLSAYDIFVKATPYLPGKRNPILASSTSGIALMSFSNCLPCVSHCIPGCMKSNNSFFFKTQVRIKRIIDLLAHHYRGDNEKLRYHKL